MSGTPPAAPRSMPIRRHEALRSLSRDHHLALQLARGLQSRSSSLLRARLPEDARERAAYVRRMYFEELAGHFAAEDDVLRPATSGQDAVLDRLWTEIEAEHVEMRALVDALDSTLDTVALEATLDRFGRLLEAHVRKEERALYERIQAVLDADTLTRISQSLARHMEFHETTGDGASA